MVTRSSGDREGLVRLVRAPDGQVFVDYRGKLPGRGAWVSPTRAAFEKLEQHPKILVRPLRGSVITTGLLAQARAANAKALRNALSLCARAGLLKGGKDGVRNAIASGRTRAVLLASDCSPRLAQDLTQRRGDTLIYTVPLDRDALGHQIGKGPRAALAVLTGKPSKVLLRELARCEGLG